MPARNPFQLVSDFSPTGDQPAAIDALSAAVAGGRRYATLLGATGTGKTFTMANVIERVPKPTLIISHNKTLAAQLYEEMRELFPDSAVAYFVSYYDYYQPEAYIPQRDIYIEKDASRNDDLDRLRLAATSSLLSRDDVIIIASVSCIFGLGSPEAYRDRVLAVALGQEIDRRQLLLSLADMQYARSDMGFERGQFRARGDVIEVYPAYEQYAVRIELFGDTVDRLELIHPVSGEVLASETQVFIFPAVHYVMPEDQLAEALAGIRAELDERVIQLRHEGKLLEAQRLLARTKYDLEMMAEVGYCSGIENYAAKLEGRPPGSRPNSLLDYFRHVPGREPDDWLVFIDESHVTIPQIRAMFNGDRARKKVLVEHGFRLPSALDNRPLTFEEFEEIVPQVVFVSATPGPYELDKCGGEFIEQVIRPTGLPDPVIEVRPARGQVADLIEQCKTRSGQGERVLVTVLTKRLAEDLTNYLHDTGLKVRFLHSEIDTLERVEILRELREGDFDVLVGVNLLREGLDLPEVSLVCIVDADKTGFLRSTTSLIQTMGRAARNVNATVVMYADTVTEQMQQAIDETTRRRDLQLDYNRKHNITPETIRKAIRRGIETELKARKTARTAVGERAEEEEYDIEELIGLLEKEMFEAAQQLEFEKAAALRDRIAELKAMPEYGSDRAIRMSQVAAPKPRPGAARSSAGITRSGAKKRPK
ncbi:MAG: excinuclease ABC subunit UvrB [Phycisphaerales bacterium]|nr:MAG: excinuclease ABC subunit UvrB [Phycisphaerales bacterium]